MKLRTTFFLPLLFVSCLSLSLAQTGKQPSLPLTAVPEITNYTHWSKVNDKPHFVVANQASLCVQVPLQRSAPPPGPHKDKWVNIYVNPVGGWAMCFEAKPVFPVGSIIVKQKLSYRDSKKPELLTVMRKREKGYNPAGGDWEYSVFDGEGKKLEAQGRLGNCQTCHAQWKATDYISRAYFTDFMMQQLR